MSVTTTFTEKQEELKNTLTTCIRLIHELTDEKTWGHDDVSNGHIIELSLMRIELRKMRDKL